MRRRNDFFRGLLAGARITLFHCTPLRSLGQLNAVPDAARERSEIIAQGQDFTVYRTVTRIDAGRGRPSYRTNQFTLLENAVNYFEDGTWKESQDVIQRFRGAVVAREGPHKAIFSADLNTDAVFDILSAEGHRLRGGVRQIQITDLATGQSFVLGTVRPATRARLVPPNQLLYPDAFDGLKADLLLEWRHNHFSHNVIIRERPAFPAAFSANSSRLEVLTEFVEAPDPQINEQVFKAAGQPDVVDDVVLGFGSLFVPRGRAFPIVEDRALNLSGAPFREEGVPVVKQWQELPDGRRFLLESVSWVDLQPALLDLPAQQGADAASPTRNQNVASARVWPPVVWPIQVHQEEPIEMASAPYSAKGLLLDFDLSGSATSFTFTNGVTFYIASSFSVGPGAPTFQPGCVLKYANNAYLLLLTSPLFPYTLQTQVFTSKNDQSFGDLVGTGTDPALEQASQALWMYYLTVNTTVDSARFRWAKRGIQYDQNAGVNVLHTAQNSLFENITGTGNSGIYVNLPSGPGLTLSNVEKCNVATPVQVATGLVNGSMTDPPFCTDKQFLAVRNKDAWSLINPPDTMGAVGPTHFLMTVNQMVAIFGKGSGSLVETAEAGSFFGGTSTTEMFDPRVVYDHEWGRWVSCMYDRGSTSVRLAISKTSGPLGLIANWDRYDLSVAEPPYGLDYPTMGLDSNGIYVAIKLAQGSFENPTQWMYKVVPIKKEAGGTISIKPAIKINDNTGYNYLHIQPAVNLDPVNSSAVAWFVGKDDKLAAGSITYSGLVWTENPPGTWTANFLETTWTRQTAIPDPFYDLDNDLDFVLPQKPSGGGSAVHRLTGSRLMMAVVRNGFLWTCHHVGLDGPDEIYNGGAVDRMACSWYQMRIKADNTLSLDRVADGADYGRVFDVAASNPYFYCFPSLAVNASGDMLMGFSGSKATEFIGAFYSGKRGDSGMSSLAPVLIQAGRDYFDDTPWGDYTYTTVDTDSLTFWTIQQYAETRNDPIALPDPYYGLWIAKVKRN